MNENPDNTALWIGAGLFTVGVLWWLSSKKPAPAPATQVTISPGIVRALKPPTNTPVVR